MSIENTNLTEVKYYSPIYPQLYPFNEDGSSCEDDAEPLTQREAAAYFDEIVARVKKEELPTESERGLMEYYHGTKDSANDKVISAKLTVELIDGKVWAVMVTQQREPLTPAEQERFLDYIEGQYSDGWGEGFEQREIPTDEGRLYVSFWSGHREFHIITEQEFLSQNPPAFQIGGIS